MIAEKSDKGDIPEIKNQPDLYGNYIENLCGNTNEFNLSKVFHFILVIFFYIFSRHLLQLLFNGFSSETINFLFSFNLNHNIFLIILNFLIAEILLLKIFINKTYYIISKFSLLSISLIFLQPIFFNFFKIFPQINYFSDIKFINYNSCILILFVIYIYFFKINKTQSFNKKKIMFFINYSIILIIGILIGIHIPKSFDKFPNILIVNSEFIFNFIFAISAVFFYTVFSEETTKKFYSGNFNVFYSDFRIYILILMSYCSFLINFQFFLCISAMQGIIIISYFPPFFLININFFKQLFSILKILFLLILGFSISNFHIMLFPEKIILIISISGVVLAALSEISKSQNTNLNKKTSSFFIQFLFMTILSGLLFYVFKYYNLKILFI